MPNYLGDEIIAPDNLIAILRRHYSGNIGTDKLVPVNSLAQAMNYRFKSLREVTPRAVDFFALKMLPGDISIITDDEQLKAAVEQILLWTNFNEIKRLWLTDLALTGDLFLQTFITPNKTAIHYILPEDVALIEEDWRGIIQKIRIENEVPGPNGVLLTHTEIWDKKYFAIWEHNLGAGTPEDELGTPIDYGLLSAYGLDFCPIVHIKFKDTGDIDNRGVGCVTSSLPLIREACREASVMARQAFRDRSTFVLSAASVDANNFTLDPIKVIKHVDVIDSIPGDSQQDVTPDDIWQAPAMSTITSLLAGIPWDGIQHILDATMDELMQEIPALRYWAIKETSNTAAMTVSLMMDAALSQAREAARSFVSGLVRACQISLTMGIYQGLFEASLGNYASGDFEFEITAGQAFEPSTDEKAITLKVLTDAGIPLEPAMKMAAFTDAEIEDAGAQAKAQQAEKVNQLKDALTTINTANVKPVV